MAIRKNNFPSSEVREKDVTEVAQTASGTIVAVQGFTHKGEVMVPTMIHSTAAYLNTFGKPMTDAEFYTYLSVDNIISEGGTALVSRLPYNNAQSTQYNGIAVTIGSPETTVPDTASDTIQSLLTAYKTLDTNAGFCQVTTNNVSITNEFYAKIESSGDFSVDEEGTASTLATANFFIADARKSVQDDQLHRGSIFVTLFDPLRAIQVQQLLLDGTPETDDVINALDIKLITKLIADGTNDIGNYADDLYNTIDKTSLSRQIAKLFPTYETGIDSSGSVIERTIDFSYNNFIGIAVCRITASDSVVNRNVVEVLEQYVGCIAPFNNPINLQSQYIVDLVNSSSSYIRMIANRLNQTDEQQTRTGMMELPVNASAGNLLYIDNDGIYKTTSFQFGSDSKLIAGAVLGANLMKVFGKISNVDDQQIDVVCDAGISTVAEFCDSASETGNYFEPDIDVDDAKISRPSDISTWISVAAILDSFCAGKRKDCMAIIDAPRNASLNGSLPILSKYDTSKTFANSLINGYLAVSSALNSSYSALYANWLLVNNPYTGKDTWVPPSCYAAAICCRCDMRYNPWNSPAYLERGTISGVAGLSLYPGDEEESFLYPKSINYIKYFTSDGYVVWGQKTTQKKAGAFDRVNVRRSLLRIERFLYNIGRKFIGKGNSVYNRRQWVDLVDPYLSSIKAQDGIYDYLPVCDEQNNIPAIIDNNEFRAAALIQPVKEADFVITDVVTTSTGVTLEEIVKTVI